MPIPSLETLSVTWPNAAKLSPELVIVTATLVPAWKSDVVLTKQPDRLRSRVSKTKPLCDSTSTTSTIAPKL